MTEIQDGIKLPPSIARAPEVQAQYEAHCHHKRINGDTTCDMCRLVPTEAKQLKMQRFGADALKFADTGISVIENSFPYNAYDGQEVITHDLLIPNGHYSELDELPDQVMDTYFRALTRAAKEYDMYMTRTPGNATTSIPGHMHTHLMRFGRRIRHQHYSHNGGFSVVHFDGDIVDDCPDC